MISATNTNFGIKDFARNLPVGIVQLNAKGELVFLNPAAERLPCIDRNRPGKPFVFADKDYRTIHEDGSAFPVDTHPAFITLKTGLAQQQVVMGIVSPSGKTTWLSISSEPEFLEDNYTISGVICVLTDISDIRDVQKALDKSEDRYYRMIDIVEDYAILMINKGGIVQNWNKGAERIKGYQAKEIIGSDFRRFYTMEDRQKGLPDKFLALACKQGKAMDEGWRVKKDGTLFWAHVLLTTIYNDKGDVIGFTKVTRDLTDRRQYEEQLRESEDRFRKLTLNVPGVVYQWVEHDDGRFGFRYVSPQIEEYFGVAVNDMNTLQELLHPDDRMAWRQSIDEANKTRTPWSFEGRFLYPDKSVKWWSASSVITKETPTSKTYTGILFDITEKKQLEILAKEREEQIKLFIKHTPASVAMFDQRMHYILASDRWYTDYDLDGKDIIGKHHYEVFPEIKEMPDWQKIHQDCLAGAIVKREMDPFTRKDGKLEWLRYEIHPWRSANGEIGGIIMFTEVITEKVNFQKNLEKLNEQLLVSNRELEQFAYVASHDLQEPLRMVSSFLQLLQRKYGEQLDETATRYIEFAVDGSARMKQLINDLLEFSRVGSGKGAFEKTDLHEVLQKALRSFEPALSEGGSLMVPRRLPVVNGTPLQLLQVFQNLIGNALKYKKEKEPIRIEIGWEEDEEQWKFFVKDNGIGIEEKFWDRIFIIFQRLHGTADYTGTGMGLSICRKIVQRHGGNIWVRSEPGQGSTFYFTLSKNK